MQQVRRSAAQYWRAVRGRAAESGARRDAQLGVTQFGQGGGRLTWRDHCRGYRLRSVRRGFVERWWEPGGGAAYEVIPVAKREASALNARWRQRAHQDLYDGWRTVVGYGGSSGDRTKSTSARSTPWQRGQVEIGLS